MSPDDWRNMALFLGTLLIGDSVIRIVVIILSRPKRTKEGK